MADAETLAVFFVQPVDSGRSVIRGVLDREPSGRRPYRRPAPSQRAAVGAARRWSNGRRPQNRRRRRSSRSIERVSPELAEMPELPAHGRKAALRVEVARKWQAADGIAGFELRPVKGIAADLPAGRPYRRAHAERRIRQYSITNGPGESDSYVIGVKLRAGFEGRLDLHARHGARGRRAGDLRAAQQFSAAPRRDQDAVHRRRHRHHAAARHGAGAASIRACRTSCTISRRATAQLAFPDRLDGADGHACRRISASPPDETGAKLRRAAVVPTVPGMHLYLCGPGPMLEAGAADRGRAGLAGRRRCISNTSRTPRSSTTVRASRWRWRAPALTLQVPAGKTILEVMREAGIDMPSSCEQGACGTCLATVIEGEPDHQDVYLNDAEKQSGTKIMTCVSRAKSARLVLDI